MNENIQDTKEYKNYVEALRGLRDAVLDLKASSLDARDAMGKLVNDSHLRSTLSLLRNDLGFRRLLDLQHD